MTADSASVDRSRLRTVGALAVALAVAGAVFAMLARGVAEGDTFGWDLSLFRLLDEVSGGRVLHRAATALLALGGEYWDSPPFVLTAGAVAACIAWGRPRAAVLLLVTLAGSVVLAHLLQPQFERVPLRDHHGELFPSGHAMASAAVVGSLVVGFWSSRARWTVTVFGALLVVAYGWALVYLRRHYASDVLGGWCLAVIIVAAAESVIGARNSRRDAR